MRIIKDIQEMHTLSAQWRSEGKTIGLVPTMGYLHEGHASLMKKGVEQCDKVVVSVFLNPMQFGPTEDLAAYPRDFERDSKLCEDMGVAMIFHPEPEEMYSPHFCSYVDMSVLTEDLCGKSRPVHFRGVCTVCNKLFNIVQPDKAFFGEKDAQQLAVIKRMVEDLNMDLEIVGCPIVREEDGLAKSSRNTYLNAEERKAALILSKSIFLGQKMVEEGERDARKVVKAMTELIETEPQAHIDYVKVVDGLTMQPIDVIDRPIVTAIAVYINDTARLIDNFHFDPEGK